MQLLALGSNRRKAIDFGFLRDTGEEHLPTPSNAEHSSPTLVRGTLCNSQAGRMHAQCADG